MLERRIDQFCRGRLADYKIPVIVEIAAASYAAWKDIYRPQALLTPY